MTYAINVKINGENKTVIIDSAVPSEAVRAEVQNVVDFSLPEERETVVRKFIADINDAMKKCACASIVANYPGDMVQGVLSRVVYARFKYNANENTLKYFSVAEKDNVPIFVEVNDVMRYIRNFNKGKADGEKIKFTGDFKRKVWALFVITRHAILENLSESDIAKIKDIAENKAELFKDEKQLTTFKGFCKLSLDNVASLTAQQEILDFFYCELNKKTGKNVKAVKKFKDENGKEISAFKFIEGEMRKTSSVSKTIKEKDETVLFNILCNMYVTSEQALKINSKGAKIEDAFATINPSKEEKAEAEKTAWEEFNENLAEALAEENK